MRDNSCAIVLGGIVSHIPLIEKLQQRGYYVVLVDYLDDPPAKRFANEHAQISTFDEEAILALAKERGARIIVNCCLEHLNAIVSRLSAKLELPCLYPEETALNVSEKSRMKAKLLESGVPTSKYTSVSSLDDNSVEELGFPMFVKPADGSGSNGVSRAENPEELRDAFEKASSFSRSGKVIIEEEAIGLECNVYCYIKDGKAEVLLSASKYSEIHNKDHANTKCVSTYAPAPISRGAERSIALAAQGIADGFALDSTPMFMQLIVNGDEISVIEFACRIPGGYSYRSILNKLGFDYFEFTLDVLLGNDPDCSLTETGEISLVHSFYARPCILDAVIGTEALIEDGTIVDVNLPREKGSVISCESCNREKVGHFVVAAQSPDEAIDKVDIFFDTVKVLDSKGKDVLRRDLRLARSQVL